MIWKSVAAIPELLLVGRKETMQKAHPYSVSAYDMQKKKNSGILTFVKTPSAHMTVIITEVFSEIRKKTIHQLRK